MSSVSITNVTRESGQTRITAEFTTDYGTFMREYMVDGLRPANWLSEHLHEELRRAQEAYEYAGTVQVGEVDTKAAETQLTEREQYAADLLKYQKFLAAARQGFAPTDSPDLLALKNDLAQRFKPEFVDLF